MTENKRFVLRESTYNDSNLVIDDNKGKFTFSALPKHKAVNYCTVLNELADENEQLKSSVQYWNDELKKVVNENEQLKSENNKLNNILGRILSEKTVIDDLKEENEQLKEALKNKYYMEICENCKHGHYWITNDIFGKESHFKCYKGHTDKSAEITECNDFELNLEELLK